MKVLLIDALNLIRRIYEAIPVKTMETVVEGAATSALGAITRTITEVNPTHVLCVFDGGRPTWRHELYPDYKANRPPTPEAVVAAADCSRRKLTARGIATAWVPNVEADDVIASVAQGLGKRRVSTVILSTDQGYVQLLSEYVVIRHPVKREYRDVSWAREKYGVAPELFNQFVALTGSSSDNIRGVPGIGPKTAAPLLNEYGSIERLLAAYDRIPGKTGRAIGEHKNDLLLALKLLTLKNDIHVGANLKDMRVPAEDS